MAEPKSKPPDPLANWTIIDQSALIALLKLRMDLLGSSEGEMAEFLALREYVVWKVRELTDDIVKDLGIIPRRRRRG